jgi:hypothetical protein
MLAIVNYSLGPGIDQRPRILKKQQPNNEALIREACNSTMRNLKLHNGDFRYRSAEEGELVEIRVYYDPASRKKVYGEVDPRGIWIGVHPIELHDGVISVRFCEGPAISGLKFFVAAGSDDDPRPFVAVAERLDPLVPEVARIWRLDNERAIQILVAAIEEIWQGGNKALIREASNSRMHNLKLEYGEFRYFSADEGELVEFRVYYDPASRKEVAGEVDPRGIWIGVHPVEINDGVISVRAREGPTINNLKFFLAAGSDDDPRPFVAAAERLDPLALEVTRIWKSENEGAIQMILAAIDEIRRGDHGMVEEGL